MMKRLLLIALLLVSPAFASNDCGNKTIASPDGSINVPYSDNECALFRAQQASTVSQKPLSEKLNDDFSSLPVVLRAQFAPLKAAVKLLLEQGDTEAAKLVIQGAQIPAELEPLRTQMLDKFNQ